MKKSIFAGILLFLITAPVFAQEGTTSFGFTAGFVQPNEYYRAGAGADKLTKRLTNGFKVGFITESTFIKGFGVSMGLNYGFAADIQSYQRDNQTSLYPQSKEDHFYHFLEIPIDWQYKFTIAKKTYLTVYSGPTLQIGLSNTFEKYSKKEEGVTKTTTDIYTISADYDDIRDYNRVNVTWGVGLGFQYDRYFIRGGYDFGIMPIYHDSFFNTSASDKTEGWHRKGRLDQWQLKLGIYLWEMK